MGRKSKGRGSIGGGGGGGGVRGMMRGMKNRWGRFQCPRDGSICKSLEAWHWHRHKYHQTEHINYVELSPDDDDDSAPPPTTATSPTSSSHPHPPSPRLLPPEAFAPRRPEVLFPDDASDLTEPEIPVLLSEEVTSRQYVPPGGGPEVVLWEVMDEATSGVDEEHDSRIHPQRREPTTDSHSLHDSAARLHGNDFHDNQESKTTRDSRSQERLRDSRSLQSPSRETNPRHHGNDSHGNQRHDRSCSDERNVGHSVASPHRPTTFSSSRPTTSPSSSLDVVALFVLSLLQRDGVQRSAQDILREVESRFPGPGLSRDGLQGVVTGALMGARDQWNNGYNAGWKDGAKEVLNAPLLRSVPPSLHSPGGASTPNDSSPKTGQVTLLTPQGQMSANVKEGTLADKSVDCRRNSIERLGTSAEGTHHHDSDLYTMTRPRDLKLT